MSNSKLEIATALTKRLNDKGVQRYKVKIIGWDDCQRSDGSVFGKNITDTTQTVVQSDGTFSNEYVIGPDNFNGAGVIMKLCDVIATISEPDGTKPRLKNEDGSEVTVAHILKNAGTFFAHKGIAPTTNLLLSDDEQARFTAQVVFLEVAEGAEAQTIYRARNYQSRVDDPRNVTLFTNAQGTVLGTDATPAGNWQDLMTEAVVGGELQRFYTATDVTKRSIKQSGTETAEEAAQAVAENKSAETPIGPRGCRRSAATMFCQFPIKQKPCTKPAPNASDMMVAGAYTSLSSWGNSNGPPVYRSLGGGGGDDDARSPVAKAARTEPEPATVCKMGRFYRGKHAGKGEKITNELTRDSDGGLATITMTLPVIVPPGFTPTDEDIDNAVALLDSYYEAAAATGGTQCKLFDKPSVESGAVGPMSATDAVKVAETVAAINAPKSEMPVF